MKPVDPYGVEACTEVARAVQQRRFLDGDIHGARVAKAIAEQLERIPVSEKKGDTPATREFLRFEQWVNGTSETLDEMKQTTSERTHVGVGLLHLALEHQIGILALSDRGLIGSARALLRPQVDAVLRGIWYLHKATDEEVRAFIDGGEPPRYRLLLAQIGDLKDFKGDLWENLRTKAFPTLHDYTHGGFQQVIARITREEIVANYQPADAIWTMRSSSSWGLMAGFVMAGFCDDEAKGEALWALHQRLYDSPAEIDSVSRG